MTNGIPHRTEDKANRFVGFSRSSCSHSVSHFSVRRNKECRRNGLVEDVAVGTCSSSFAVWPSSTKSNGLGFVVRRVPLCFLFVCFGVRRLLAGRRHVLPMKMTSSLLNPCRRERMEVKAVRKWVCIKKRRYCDMRHT
jgi:hypothetical protein